TRGARAPGARVRRAPRPGAPRGRAVDPAAPRDARLCAAPGGGRAHGTGVARMAGPRPRAPAVLAGAGPPAGRAALSRPGAGRRRRGRPRAGRGGAPQAPDPAAGGGVMWSLAWPWMLLALPLPWLVRRFLPAARRKREAALRVPDLHAFDVLADRSGTEQLANWRFWLAGTAWLLLVLAAARPERVGEDVEVPVSGRKLMLAVDLSGSMDAKEFELGGRRVDRLIATKAVASDFIRRREGDRIGLILFGERAYVQAPLTLDRETVNTLLMESFIGLAGEKTAIGDAITLAVKRLYEQGAEASEQVLVLLTDGANTAGAIDPIKAAELAADIGLRIYTIG